MITRTVPALNRDLLTLELMPKRSRLKAGTVREIEVCHVV